MDKDNPTPSHEEIAEIEERLEELAEQAERCRKAVVVSKWIASAGVVVLAAAMLDPDFFTAINFVLGVVATMGGLVSYGSNRSSGLEIVARRQSLTALRARLLDAMPMKTILESSESQLVPLPPRSVDG